MKRRRFITFGSILAMSLSLATVSYVAWLAVLDARGISGIATSSEIPWSISHGEVLYSWREYPDYLMVCYWGRDISLEWTTTRPCASCGKRHGMDLDCNHILTTVNRNLGRIEANRKLGPMRSFRSTWGRFTEWKISFPTWLPIPVLAVYPIVYSAWRFCRRRRLGHCLHCDYDLTGNESGVCPECGTKIAEEPPAQGVAKPD